jgi:hypothetical protein
MINTECAGHGVSLISAEERLVVGGSASLALSRFEVNDLIYFEQTRGCIQGEGVDPLQL